MDFINSLSPARKKSLLAAAILLIIALVIEDHRPTVGRPRERIRLAGHGC